MEDTLRYFFSAIFQGFAAIITLGAMYFLYYFERNNKQKESIEDKLKSQFVQVADEDQDYIDEHGINRFMEEKVILRKGESKELRRLLDKHKSLSKKEASIKESLSNALLNTVIILITTLISLFLVGYYDWLDKLLLIVGIGLIGLSISVLLLIKKIIKKIITE